MKCSSVWLIAGLLMVANCKHDTRSGRDSAFTQNAEQPDNRAPILDPPDSKEEEDEKEVDMASKLVGSWERECHEVPGMKYRRVDKVDATNDTITYERTIYEDEDCAEKNSVWKWELTPYKVGKKIKVTQDGKSVDAFELDVTYEKLTRTINSKDKIEDVNAMEEYYGHPGKDWKVNEEMDITGETNASTTQKARGMVDRIYVIFDRDAFTIPADDDAKDLFAGEINTSRKETSDRAAVFKKAK